MLKLSVIQDVKELPLMEHFYTIQGEGFYQGSAAYFVRLGGCDVGCVWCDVKDSWDAAKHPLVKVNKITEFALESKAGIAVITGGEPLMYQLDYLCKQLHLEGLKTHIETSGAHPLSGKWDWICFSPKKFKAPLPEIFPVANELKVVVYNKHDFKWAEEFAEQVSPDCHLYLQPEWDKATEMIPLIIEYVKENPKWKICLQIHKYMDIP